MAEGKLYLIATPIGNLGDITLRALEQLKTADMIAAEDTRRTLKLLTHYGIKKKLVSYHEHSGAKKTKELVGMMRSGAVVALVSDAGTPIISDPGFALVRECLRAGVDVESLPGANAAVTAVTLSGIDCTNFVFAGFLPAKDAARRRELERLRDMCTPVVLYESPGRILKTLGDVCAVWGSAVQVCAARELTKLHEELLRGNAGSVREALERRDSVKGEFVLVVGVAENKDAVTDDMVMEALAGYLREGKTKKEAVALTTAKLSCPKNRVYQLSLDITERPL